MRCLHSLWAVLLAAGITLSGAWPVMAWSDAGAPSLPDAMHRHPAPGPAFGVFSNGFVVASAW